MLNALVDVSGLLVGHWSDPEAATGCTVILAPDGATASVDVRGSAPGTRETDLLDPVMRVDQVHGLVLSGGSAFGLGSADGVVRWLHERGYGWYTPVTRVPIVPAAILFDLGLGGSNRWPSADDAYAACEAATPTDASRGSIGAGTGCSVGKLLGFERACRGGLGQASVTLPGGVVVSALVAVNALGDIVNPTTATIIAGARDPETQNLVDALGVIQSQFDQYLFRRPAKDDTDAAPPANSINEENTTIGVVATNARLSKVEAKKMAQMAHDGLARTMRPAHTAYDGDCLFALATGEIAEPVELSILGAIGAEVMAEAVLDGVRSAQSAYGLLAASELIPRMIGQSLE